MATQVRDNLLAMFVRLQRPRGHLRDEVLNGESFDSVLKTRVILGRWVTEYNTFRPHRGFG